MRPPSPLQVRDYRLGDAAQVPARHDFIVEHAAQGAPLFDGPPEGRAWTLMDKGRPIAVGGVAQTGPEDFALWSYTGALTRREWVRAAADLAAVIEAMRGSGAKRLTALVRRDFPEARAFLARLGFVEAAPEDDDPATCRRMVFHLGGA